MVIRLKTAKQLYVYITVLWKDGIRIPVTLYFKRIGMTNLKAFLKYQEISMEAVLKQKAKKDFAMASLTV